MNRPTLRSLSAVFASAVVALFPVAAGAVLQFCWAEVLAALG